MKSTTVQIADTTMESSMDDDDDHLEDELLERRREARRRQHQRRSQRRQHRRAESQLQQQARQIRRRPRAHQELQQRFYYPHSRTLVANDEMNEERLFEAYDGDTMSPKDHRWEREPMNEWQGVAALERAAFIHDEREQSQVVHALEASQEQTQPMQQTIADDWDRTRLHDVEAMSMSPSFDSVLDSLEQIRQIDLLERSQEAREQRQYNHDQEQLEQWEHPENE